MTDADIKRLKRLAKQATPGPWRVNMKGHSYHEVARVNDLEIAPPNSVDLSHWTVDAAYIAAASPDVVLALLDEIERLRAELAETAPLTRFGAACLIAHREDLADLDAFWLEYSAERAGCLGYVESAEPCGEDCRCAEYGDDFPTQCLRTPVNLWRLAVRIDAAMKEAK